MPPKFNKDNYEISTDQTRLDIDLIHDFLYSAYWSRGIPRKVVEKSIRHSLNFGLYETPDRQVGFARVVTDRAVFAYLADVFVLPQWRGRGLGLWLLETVLAHEDLQRLRRFSLATADAHSLYARLGFRAPSQPEREMLIQNPAEGLYE